MLRSNTCKRYHFSEKSPKSGKPQVKVPAKQIKVSTGGSNKSSRERVQSEGFQACNSKTVFGVKDNDKGFKQNSFELLKVSVYDFK